MPDVASNAGSAIGLQHAGSAIGLQAVLQSAYKPCSAIDL